MMESRLLVSGQWSPPYIALCKSWTAQNLSKMTAELETIKFFYTI